MSNNDVNRQIVLSIAAVSSRTKWAFVEVETSFGAAGVGEATLGGQEMALEQEMRHIGPHLIGTAPLPGHHKPLPKMQKRRWLQASRQ